MDIKTHLDLFSGFSGFSIAAEKYGIKTIGFSDIDKSSCALLKYRYPKIPNFGDITKIEPSSLPDFDLMTGGFP